MARQILRMLAILVALGTAEARSEEPLSLDDALDQAMRTAGAMRSATLGASAAEARLLAARGPFDPGLELAGNWRRSDQEGFFQGFPFESEQRSWDLSGSLAGTAATGTTYALSTRLDRDFTRFLTDFGPGLDQERIEDAYRGSFDLSLTQSILRGSRLAYNLQHVEQARRALDIAELALEQQRQQVLGDISQAYWEWVHLRGLEEIAREALSVAEESARVIGLQVEAGELPPVDRTRHEAARVQARAEWVEAQHAALQARDALLISMGREPGVALRPTTQPEPGRPLELQTAAVVEVALQQNLDLTVARAQLEDARRELSMARHATLPDLSATGAVGRSAQQDTAGAALGEVFGDEARPFVSAGGVLHIPLGNRAARGERDRALVEVHERKLEVEELERSIQAEVEQQVRQLRAAWERVELATTNLRLAEETLEAEEARAEVGRALQRDVLEARVEAQRAREEVLRAEIDHRMAFTELLRLQGRLDGRPD